jgi:dCTP deaminase
MTLLSDWQILRAIEEGGVSIDPFDRTLVQPASVDLRLSNAFRRFLPHGQLDPGADSEHLTYLQTVESGQPFILSPGQFALASTVEEVRLSDEYAGRIEGKSSMARLGVIIHAAGFVDPGFLGQLTLEMTNINSMPVLLWPSQPIAQLSITKVARSIRGYGHPDLGSHYQGQRGPTSSLMHEGWRVGW